MRPLARTAAAALLAALVLTAGSAGAATVELPADPPARRTVTLTEQWRIGADDEDVLLGVVTAAVIDPQGHVCLVDRQLSQIVVMDQDGEYVTTIGRKGDGPGELNEPHDIILLDDAGTLGAVQGFPGRIIGLDLDGNPAGDITLGGGAEEGGFSFLRECRRVGDVFYGNTGRMTFDQAAGKGKRRTILATYDRDGHQITLLGEHFRENDFGRPSFDEAAEYNEFRNWAVGPDGRVYTTPDREAFTLRVRSATGDEIATWHRPFTPRQRTAEEMDEVASELNIVRNGRRIEMENKALDTDPAIRDLQVGPDGRVYVINAYNFRQRLEPGLAARYDVISPDGEYLEELTLAVPGCDGEQDALVFIDGTHFLLLKNFEDAAASMDRRGAPGAEEEDEPDAEAAPLEVVFLTLE